MNVDKDYYQRRSGLKYYLDYLYLLKKVRKKKIYFKYNYKIFSNINTHFFFI